MAAALSRDRVVRARAAMAEHDPRHPPTADEAPTLGSAVGRLSPAAAFRLAIEAGETPDQIGPYHLLRRIGEGGMGEVWEAEQREPIQRRVAVKLVKLGMDTRQFVARFESERQALALMEHPAIARVIDGGATDAGRPYFVMEYVEGAPITEYGDRESLTVPERIELFIAVCDGVQHAHHKGVIHRDLKPSNVLVTEIDGRPMPKIIDFGVAKATTASLTDKSAHTVLGGWIGTPAYMSPEQARITDDIDTRTDVYSLGVMLYELLTGVGPFDTDTLDAAGFDEIRRLIRDVEPPRPSTRASVTASSTAAAEHRRTEPRALVKRLRGELDWIVMKAIEKEKERRYGSPAELAADLRRHLESRPVLAGPPSPIYRARKFVRRHRVLVAAGAAVAVALVAAVGGTTAGLVRARSEARRANQEARTSAAVSSFLTDLFRSEDPAESRGADLSARDILERGSARLETELGDQPAVRAKLLETIGVVYRNLGLHQESETNLRQALELRRSLADGSSAAADAGGAAPSDPELARALLELSITVKERGDFEQAEALLEEARTIMESALAPGDPLRVSILTSLGLLHRDRGERVAAEPLLEQALAEARRAPDLDPDDLATAINNLALHYRSAQRYDRAEPLFREAIALTEGAPEPNEPTLAVLYNNLGLVLSDQRRLEDAAAAYGRALTIFERVAGPEHPRVAVILHNQGDLYRELGSFDRAAAAYDRSRRILEASLGADHPYVATSLIGSAKLHTAQGELDAASGDLDRALAIREAAFGATSPLLREPLQEKASVLRREGRDREAATLTARVESLTPEAQAPP